MKTCTKCNERKRAKDFYARSSASDGLQSWCKNCQRLAVNVIKKRQRATGPTPLPTVVVWIPKTVDILVRRY